MQLSDHTLLGFLALGQMLIGLLIVLFMKAVDQKFMKGEIFKNEDEE
jgi:hypothetical protein